MLYARETGCSTFSVQWCSFVLSTILTLENYRYPLQLFTMNAQIIYIYIKRLKYNYIF